MPLPPADKPSDSPAQARTVVMLRSPREAAARAIVYRRRRAERPHNRGLRLAGLAGTLLVHLLVLFGAILGPAYDLEEPPRKTEPLQVRLIERPEPPPPPPVRGTPPKRVGPRHRGTSGPAATRPSQPTPAAPAPPTPSRPDTPVITVTAPKATIRIDPVAAPPPPLMLPNPQPAPDLAPVAPVGTPPQITLDMPPVARPVPPKFQPEPVRKPQPEGNRPMPTPPSLAMPAVPAQAAPPIAPPSIALDQVAPPKHLPPSTVTLVRPQPAAAPATPQVEPIPLPAQPAPTINLEQVSAPTPIVPRERPRVQAPSIQLAEPQLAAVPLDTTAAPATPQPAAPAIEVPKATAPTVPLILARPQASLATRSEDAAPGEPTSADAAAPAAEAAVPQPGSATAPERAPASAPDATPQGSDSGTPGARENAPDTASAAGAAAPQPGQGKGKGQSEGKQGKAQPGADEGAEHGRLGSYIQLKPTGDTQVMEHQAPDIGYRPTRFEGDWTPEGESSLDTALRHAVEKTTIKHTFHLPRGVRINCKVSPLFPLALLGCGGDPPAKPAKDPELYKRLDLAPVKPLDPSASTSVAKAASTPVPAAPIHLDNAAQCAAARVAGGPLPPGCSGEETPPRPMPLPAAATSSWVPASDQFH